MIYVRYTEDDFDDLKTMSREQLEAELKDVYIRDLNTAYTAIELGNKNIEMYQKILKNKQEKNMALILGIEERIEDIKNCGISLDRKIYSGEGIIDMLNTILEEIGE